MEFIDSHAHLTSQAVVQDIEMLLSRAKKEGVEKIVNICTDFASLEKGLSLSKKHPWIYNTGATTPHDVASDGEKMFPLFEQYAKEGLFVAVGETGLDYHYEHSAKNIQKDFLKKYLHLARICKLPVVIHCREAFRDLFEIIDAEYCESLHLPGVLHCFTGTLEEAKQVIKRGWYLSLSGIVTFKKSSELQDVAKWIPLEQLLIETDTPYLAPEGKRGKPNEPANLPQIASMIAKLKNLPLEKIAQFTTENATRLFNLTD